MPAAWAPMNTDSSIQTARTVRIGVDIGIVVAKLERSLSFYRDLLGLSVVAEVTTSLIGKGRMVQLQHGESLIKLVELHTPPSKPGPTDISEFLGYRYITLLVAELDVIMAKIKARNISIALPVTQLNNGTRIAMVKDPDGNIVEFAQEVN
ncbi:VOC family protein [Leptolyngbyaceae cyanobacterium CCMR0082]|uniref:VOC family protein n=1 Tax=Adonisia turfae CCMR0082 TaxID=2304604 RepID=A0A6M0SES9_9CYAN|nr:VOC family protein [Adonisia turfae]NEZ66985.1 VOC family protein [Adonisia turfae CCMR0082]